MLNDNKHIDQLFREKLGEFEKTPPMYLWTNIQGKLNARRKERRLVILKTVSIAAAIVLAFLAGWKLTNPTDKGAIPQNSVAKQQDTNSMTNPSANETTANAKVFAADSRKDTSDTSGLTPKVIRTSNSKLSSLASFAANTSFVDNHATVQKSEDLVLSNNEKELFDKLHHNFGMVKKLTDWISSDKKDSIADANQNSKSVVIHPFSFPATNKSVTIAMNNPAGSNGRWSIKAEFAPVFNNQANNSGQGSRLNYDNSQNNKPQQTNTENTFSGGMIAGYKVGKRLILKSGFIYNNIRQSTNNVSFMGANALLFNIAGNSNIASTPAGKVNLNKTVNNNTQMDVISGSSYQLSSSANYSSAGELKQDIGFIEIPVQATYKLIDKKIAVGLTGGISTNILVGNNAILSENGEKIGTGETANMRNIVYSGAVGLEIGYVITNRITLTVEPRLKHFINSLSTNKSVNYKPSQLGIVTGLTYSFN